MSGFISIAWLADDKLLLHLPDGLYTASCVSNQIMTFDKLSTLQLSSGDVFVSSLNSFYSFSNQFQKMELVSHVNAKKLGDDPEVGSCLFNVGQSLVQASYARNSAKLHDILYPKQIEWSSLEDKLIDRVADGDVVAGIASFTDIAIDYLSPLTAMVTVTPHMCVDTALTCRYAI